MKHIHQRHQPHQAREREELERQVEILRREVRQLRLEQDLPNKANELLKHQSWKRGGLFSTLARSASI